jgi:hypothetical protein
MRVHVHIHTSLAIFFNGNSHGFGYRFVDGIYGANLQRKKSRKRANRCRYVQVAVTYERTQMEGNTIRAWRERGTCMYACRAALGYACSWFELVGEMRMGCLRCEHACMLAVVLASWRLTGVSVHVLVFSTPRLFILASGTRHRDGIRVKSIESSSASTIEAQQNRGRGCMCTQMHIYMELTKCALVLSLLSVLSPTQKTLNLARRSLYASISA